MRRLVLTIAVVAAIFTSALGATVIWGSATQPSAADRVIWGD